MNLWRRCLSVITAKQTQANIPLYASFCLFVFSLVLTLFFNNYGLKGDLGIGKQFIWVLQLVQVQGNLKDFVRMAP